MTIQINFSQFTIEDLEKWANGTAGIEVDADNSSIEVVC